VGGDNLTSSQWAWIQSFPCVVAFSAMTAASNTTPAQTAALVNVSSKANDLTQNPGL